MLTECEKQAANLPIRETQPEPIGTAVGMDEAIAYLEELSRRNPDVMLSRIINRMKYVRDKDTGVKPKFIRGVYGHKYDYWKCGHCGKEFHDRVTDNFCWNCGYRILWDSARCLTGIE